jgi:hypothetical protein
LAYRPDKESNNEKKTGKIYINGREKNIPRSGIVSVKNGEICDIAYQQTPPPAEAWSALLPLTINNAIFTARDSVADYPENHRFPPLADWLRRLDSSDPEGVDAKPAQRPVVTTFNLRAEA